MWVGSCLLPWVFCFSAQIHVLKTNAKNAQRFSVQPQKNMRPYVAAMEKPTTTHRTLPVKISAIIPGEHVNSACALLTIKNGQFRIMIVKDGCARGVSSRRMTRLGLAQI